MAMPDTDADATALNRQSYDAIAAQWMQARTMPSAAERRFLDLLCRGLPSGAAVLDLGCGSGRPIAEHLVAQGLRVTGVDQSPAMLAAAQRLLPTQTWVLAGIEHFVPAAPFAAAIAWDSLFHLPRQAHATVFQRLRAALPPGAALALTVGGSAHPAFTDTMFEHEFFYDSHPPEAAVALLREAGFEIEHSEFLNLPTSGRDKGRFAILARACGPAATQDGSAAR